MILFQKIRYDKILNYSVMMISKICDILYTFKAYAVHNFLTKHVCI